MPTQLFNFSGQGVHFGATYSYCSIVYPHLDGLIDEKEHSGLMYDSIRTKYCKPWYKACIKQSEMAYTEYMEWFLKKYHEVNMKAYKKEYRILYHEWIEDYISERFLHFNFVNTLAKNFSFLKHIKDTENFMPIVMTENPFIATTYVNLLKKSYEEGRPLSYGKTRTKSHNLTSYVHNFGQFVDYMNYVYYPALYFTFLELLSHNKIERRKIISILQIMELIDKSNLHKKMELWPQIDEDTFSKVVGLLGCMIDIKNSNSYRLLKENNCYARSSRNTPSSETISEIVYYLQRIFDYPCLLEKYFYCDNALKIYPPISKQELKNSIHPYIIASVDELLANELNSIAQERNITDLNSLLQASFIESKPKSNPSHHPTPKSNDEAPQ